MKFKLTKRIVLGSTHWLLEIPGRTVIICDSWDDAIQYMNGLLRHF